LLATGSGDRVRVYAVVNAETAIYPGDTFRYSIVVEGGPKPSRIDISPLAPFNPRPAGDGTSFQQFNDQVVISYSSNYAIVAKEVGTMHLPGVPVVVDGRTYTTNPMEVTVSKPGTTDRMQVTLSVAERTCYAGQPVVMTVQWIVSTRWQNVAFDVPVFKSSDFFIEEVSASARPGAAEQTLIDGVPTAVTGSRQIVKGMESEVFTFSKVLIPRRTGRLRLDPITVSANVAVGRTRTNDFFNPFMMKFERVSVQSEPVELEVLPLPEADRSPEFYGLIGQYTISASATPNRVSVGDPITLTIRVGGNPYLKPVEWPRIEQVPELAANFRIPTERASPVIDGGDKVFTQTIRANSDAVARIPPIPLAYFDSHRGQYVVARTEPIPLEVAPTKMLTNADVEGVGFASANREVEAIRKGLSANYHGPQLLVDQSFSLLSAALSPGYAAIWSIPLAGLVASAVIRLATRTSPESLARKRRRQAAAVAAQQLKAVAFIGPGQQSELLLSAMKGYAGDRFDRVAASLTADDCRQTIVEAIGDADTAARYADLIAACEAARYAPLDAEIGAAQVQEAAELIHAIERQLRK
jgi:hypothetical protein